ncbi:energy-coupling factor transporter transmembrane protein EcfT [candidate division KSB1 bacterium]|nr:energy-coupling factor transporter transmembrane protein EcfT [candidate division KSB1 bacterium]
MTKSPSVPQKRGRRSFISRKLTLGQYFPGQSSVHRLDPRLKLLASVSVMSLLMWVESWPALGFWILAVAVAVQRTQLPPKLFLRNLRAFLWLFAITIALHALSPGLNAEAQSLNNVGTDPRFRVWGISISWAGALMGFKYSLRLALLIIITGVLSFTTVPTDLTDGLERLLKPLQRWRVPVHELAFMTTLALRFVPAIIDEAERIHRAQLSRGAHFSGSLLARVQALVPLLVPLMVATFHRADDLAIAMEARCYRGSTGRVPFREMRFASRDFWMATSVLVCVMLTVVFEKLPSF